MAETKDDGLATQSLTVPSGPHRLPTELDLRVSLPTVVITATPGEAAEFEQGETIGEGGADRAKAMLPSIWHADFDAKGACTRAALQPCTRRVLPGRGSARAARLAVRWQAGAPSRACGVCSPTRN